jgi:opacity protein-like surface antigen
MIVARLEFKSFGGSLMRRLLVAAFIVVAAQGAAFAADPPDFPVLRGSVYEAPKSYRTNWQGFYVGGQFGYGAAEIDFTRFNEGTTWPALPGINTTSKSFGGFAGYNSQFEDVIVGIDLSYSRGPFAATAFNSATTTAPNVGPLPGLSRVSTLQTNASMTVLDFGSVRARGGYVAGNFLPYAFVGIGIGRADTALSQSITGTYEGTTVLNEVSGAPRRTAISTDTNGQFIHGVSAGFGLDWMVFGGLFVRAEYEYLQFTSTIGTNIHTARGGIGYKF